MELTLSKKLGIFINATDSEIKFNTNLNNYNMLKENFYSVIIIDINNEYAIKLHNKIKFEKNIYNYFISDDIPLCKFDKILYILKKINSNDFDKIVVIEDSYIYCDNLNEYFTYIDNNEIDFCSYVDSNEVKYHHHLFLYSIISHKIEIFINFIETEKNKDIDQDEIYKNINYNILSIFDNSIPFLKIAYIEYNDKNIFFNNDIYYKFLIDNNILPIINIERLCNNKTNYKFNVNNQIPEDFDLTIYKNSDDLKKFTNDELFKHFLNYGQFEVRIYNKNGDNNISLLPGFLRETLKKCNLLQFFDIPDKFSIYKYKEYSNDLNNLDEDKLILHWLNYGRFENRKYQDTV